MSLLLTAWEESIDFQDRSRSACVRVLIFSCVKEGEGEWLLVAWGRGLQGWAGMAGGSPGLGWKAEDHPEVVGCTRVSSPTNTLASAPPSTSALLKPQSHTISASTAVPRP